MFRRWIRQKEEERAIALRSDETGETEALPMGWNWEFFFLGWTFGFPLFRRKLYGLGALMAIILTSLLIARYYALPPSGEEAERMNREIMAAVPIGAIQACQERGEDPCPELLAAFWTHPLWLRTSIAFVSQFLLMFAMMGAHLWICFRANDRAIRARLKRGWRFADPESEALWRKRHPRPQNKGES